MKKYIRDKSNVIHVSDDNWKTFDTLTRESVNGIEETNKDIITTIKLRHSLGDRFANIILGELKKIRKQFNLQTGDGYGHAFEIFAISAIHNIDYDVTFNNYIVRGSHDGKIDAIYWKGSINKIYQIKLDYLDFSDIEKIENNYHEFLSTGVIQDKNAQDLLLFLKEHKQSIVKEKEYEIVTISNNGTTKNHIPCQLVYKKYFENLLLNKINNLEVSLTIPSENGVAKILKDRSIYAYFVDAKTFIQDLLKSDNINNNKGNLYKFFYDNVRGDLGINKTMESTIICEPNNFVKYNNGVTITGSVEFIKSTPCLIVSEPIINNGQQTIMNLVDKYPNVTGINLLIIVKNETDYEIKSKISKYTNTQRNIKPIDLLSLDSHIRNLQTNLFNLTINGEPIFLEINTSGKRHYNNILKKIYENESIISLSDFCKLYFSVDSNELGKWKSNVSIQIEQVLKLNKAYDTEKSLLICQSIIKYKKFLKSILDKNEKNRLRYADLAFMYIQYKYGYSEIDAYSIIKKINKKYYDDIPTKKRKSKLIDLYKSDDIIDKITEIVALKDDKVPC